jgi:hypothetical protein
VLCFTLPLVLHAHPQTRRGPDDDLHMYDMNGSAAIMESLQDPGPALGTKHFDP